MSELQFKQFKAQSTEVTDQGVFSAILAAWTVDRMNEQIVKGAFGPTIKAWQESGKMIPLHWDHEGQPDSIIGYIDPKSMMETDDGLYVEGHVDIDTSEKAREVWRSMKNNAVGLSFGYLTTRSMDPLTDGEPRKLLELDLFEGTVTPGPVNADTRVLQTKGLEFVIEEKAEWSGAYINDLPDSSFLYIEPGGSKDADGKTTPRSLRHFPVKDADGKVDMAHVRNALARIPQSNVPDSVKTRATAAAQRMLAAARSLSVASELPVKPPEDVLKQKSGEAALDQALGRSMHDGPELEPEPTPEPKPEPPSEDELKEQSRDVSRFIGEAVLEKALGRSKEDAPSMEPIEAAPAPKPAPPSDEEVMGLVNRVLASRGLKAVNIDGDGDIRRKSEEIALEQALGRKKGDGPELESEKKAKEPEKKSEPEPVADERTIRRQSDEIALAQALGRSPRSGPELEPVAEVSDETWDNSSDRFTDEQYLKSCVLDRGGDGTIRERYDLPIREPNGALNRNAVHLAAARIPDINASSDRIEAVKGALRMAYGELGETPPSSVKALIGWKETSVKGQGPVKKPAKGRQKPESPDIRKRADMHLLEHALGRRIQDGPELDPDPEPAPDPAPERELRRQSSELALELAVGESAEVDD